MSATLISTAVLADHLGMSAKAVRRLVGEGMPVHRSGRVLRFDPDAARRWIAEREDTDSYRDAVRAVVDTAPSISAAQADRIAAVLRT